MKLLRKAIKIAKKAHLGQFRKYGHFYVPYVQHPLRVMARVALRGGVNENVLAAAILHDVLEDSSIKYDGLLRRGIPRPVVRLVVELTNPSKGMKAPRATRKRIDREHLAKVSVQAKIIKLADRIDNVRESIDDGETPRDWLKTYLRESELLLEVLRGTDASLESELLAELRRGKKLCA
jgi:guanosine-3',5'-bis(diphosphate) 3'-pyrophosphohydrolase